MPKDIERTMTRSMKSRSLLPLITGVALFASACSSAPKAPDEPLVFYPLPPDPPRIQFLRTVSRATDIEDGRSGLDTILFGEQTIQKSVMAPYGAAVHEGKVYVADIQQGVVLTLDFTGRELGYIKLEGRAALQKPCNLEFSPEGEMYVADLGRRQVVVYDSDFNYKNEFGPFGDESRPVDLALAGDRVYVVDSGSKLIRALDRFSGEEVISFGKSEEVGQSLRSPTNITLDEEGNIYVVDTMDCRVFVFDAEGNFLRHMGAAGDTIGRFARPKGIAYSNDIFFVIDAAFENCQVFDRAGEPLMFFGGPGVGPGNLYLPAGVWTGTEGLEFFRDQIDENFEAEQLIIITNLYGPRKVNFYAMGKDKRFNYDVEPVPKAEPEPEPEPESDDEERG